MKNVLLASIFQMVLTSPVFADQVHGCIDDACLLRHLFTLSDTTGSTISFTSDVVNHGNWGVDLDGMDRSIRPGVDFYVYVNGSWDRKTPIPADQSSYGAFRLLRDLSEARVRALVEGYPRTNPGAGGDAAKVAALYADFMDEETIERIADEPLQKQLKDIREAANKAELVRLMAKRDRFGNPLFMLTVSDDQRDPERYALYMTQGGLGLGDREMYLRDSFVPQRKRYQAYIAQLLGLVGWNEPEAAASLIIAFETKLAEAHWSRAQSRDRDKTYNPLALDQFTHKAPGFPWEEFFTAAGVGNATRVVIRQVDAIVKMAQIFERESFDILQAWSAFHAVDDAAPYLSTTYSAAYFEFHEKFLSGQPRQRARWKRGIAVVEEAMGDAIGRDYVRLYFPAEAKSKMDALVTNVKAAMGARLDALQWMGDRTRAEARAKLSEFGLKIGHPRKWRDYGGLQVIPGDTFGNVLRARQFEWDFRRARIGKQVDKDEWSMTPQTVNAYYSSVKNEIVFPAAILQPPFFDPAADPAVNYGAIGGVIGHEIIHGFDDQGRKSDGKGLLRDWWTAEDAAKFEAQAAKLGAQYEAYSFSQLPGMHINGKVSMGENIGDLGGLTIALEAYRRSLQGRQAPVLDGFSGEQRLFMGWAQVWRTKWRDDALRQQLINGIHSPGQIRAFAPLRNIDAWYDAFQVTDEDPLWIAPQERVRIW